MSPTDGAADLATGRSRKGVMVTVLVLLAIVLLIYGGFLLRGAGGA